MTDINANLRNAIRAFDFRPMFLDYLGWDNFQSELPITIDNQTYRLRGVAQKRGMVVYLLESAEILPGLVRNKIDTQVARSHREHVLIFTDTARTQQVWLWALREIGRPLARRSFEYHAGQQGEALAQRLEKLAFTLDDEEDLTLVDVAGRVRAAFNVERATRRFYDQFKKERDAFETFVSGIPDVDMSRWYVSVMLNRLMFVYFIQQKGFLDGDSDYLRNRLQRMQATYGADQFDQFYRYFLLRLFHEGLGHADHDRALENLIGDVPYLNGGIFQLHEVEEEFPHIQIPDAAFERIFDFFDQYQWHLDDRPLRDDREINPDVLGYIFEKYINQKQMGAYYTKEDITEYISKNTIIPFLFDRAKEGCAVAFEDKGAFQGESSVWAAAQDDPDRYIYDAVRTGTELPLPDDIAAGLDDVSARGPWNTPAPAEYALPTEIWRETIARRQRYEEVRDKLTNGDIRDVNDFITYNLDIRQFAQDTVEQAEGSDLLTAFWNALTAVSVLDPTCGSGAFLFAALNILEPLYEATIRRMREFTADDGWKRLHPRHAETFGRVLTDIERHPNETYFIQKAIIVNNLYGVDIMAEAVEIAKLRLFLKLASQVESVDQIEPLPDIDFNIRTGNTLVGYVTREEVRQALRVTTVGDGVQQGKMVFGEDEAALAAIEEKAADLERHFEQFREQQTGGVPQEWQADAVTAKAEIERRLAELNDELDVALARQYGVDPDKPAAFQKWQESHQPFHWFTEFYGILRGGGFDVIIGNPPYVEYRLVRPVYKLQTKLYQSEPSNNLYAYCMERSCDLLVSMRGRFGMIVPAGLLGLDQAFTLRETLTSAFSQIYCSTYGIRPAKLFEGVDQRLCIFLGHNPNTQSILLFTTRFQLWNTEERPHLFPTIRYSKSCLHLRLGRIPQLGDELSADILSQIEQQSAQTIDSYYSSNRTGSLMHYHRSPRYWIRAMDFEQYFRSATRTRSIHHFRDLYIRTKPEANAVGAVLNSTLFFWWFMTMGNGRNITGSDVEQFPIGKFSNQVVGNLTRVFAKLMQDYNSNSFVRRRTDAEYQEFRPSLSKPILDDIDRILSEHFGYDASVLDFIINYDIKYRMGDELDEDGED